MSEAIDIDLPGDVVPFEVPAPKNRRQAKAEADSIANRSLPHSPQAESSLLACCVVDALDMVPRCIERHIEEDSFYLPTHRVIWSAIHELYEVGRPVATFTLAEHLHAAGLLEQAGGVAGIESVANSVATLAHSQEYLAAVVEHWTTRRMLRRLAALQEQLWQRLEPTEVETVIQEIAKDLAATKIEREPLKSLADFAYPAEDPNVLLGTRYRYICRGGMLFIVGFAGSGKSSMCYQSAAHWGVGRDFLGINCVAPLKVLVVQAEDDDGDIGEVVESLRQGCGFDEKEMQAFRSNVFVQRHKVSSGEQFLFWLETQCRRIQPDLVFLNPLFNFVGGALSDDDVANEFCNGLNRINPHDRWAYVVFHHTPKPPRAEDQGQARTNLAAQYSGFGSSVWSNRPRATIIVEPHKDDDRRFTWVLAKRGRRAGVLAHVPHGACTREEIVTKIHARHSDRRIQVNGTSYPMILWEPDPEGGKAPETAPSESRPMRGRFRADEVLQYFPRGQTNHRPAGAILREVNAKLGRIPEKEFYDHLRKFVDSGVVIHEGKSGGYYRPTFEDGPPVVDTEIEPLARVPVIDSPEAGDMPEGDPW